MFSIKIIFFIHMIFILCDHFCETRFWSKAERKEEKKKISNPTVRTTSGFVEGKTISVLNKTIDEYLGIPYAEPPVGSLRFAKPKPLSEPIEGVIDATRVKSSCMQPNNPIYTVLGDFSEDCLHLNVWSPRNTVGKLVPVMYWIHGGGFCFGSATQSWYNGSLLAAQDLVIVTVNYRLGWFGFLYGGDESAPGNVGLFDQALGLTWVRDNIHLFGGDKNQVTIFGQSAGSWSVSAHILSPISKSLFQRAIMKGGAHLYNRDRPPISREEGLKNSKELGERLGCKGETWLKCLRDLKADQLEVWIIKLVYPVEGTEFLPLTARKALEQGQFNKDLDLLAGVVKDEGPLMSLFVNLFCIVKKYFEQVDFNNFLSKLDRIFHNIDIEKSSEFYLGNIDLNNGTAIKWKTYELVGHVTIVCPTYYFAKLFSQYSSQERNVYFYELTHTAYKDKFLFDYGVHHGSEFELVFGHPMLFPNSTGAEDIEFSREVMKLFTDFAKTGRTDKEWPKLVGTDALPHLERIRDLNPWHKSLYENDLFRNSCNGLWKGYF